MLTKEKPRLYKPHETSKFESKNSISIIVQSIRSWVYKHARCLTKKNPTIETYIKEKHTWLPSRPKNALILLAVASAVLKRNGVPFDTITSISFLGRNLSKDQIQAKKVYSRRKWTSFRAITIFLWWKLHKSVFSIIRPPIYLFILIYNWEVNFLFSNNNNNNNNEMKEKCT